MDIRHLDGESHSRSITWCGVIAVLLAILFPLLLRAQTASNGSGPTPNTHATLSTPSTTATVDVNAMLQSALQQKLAFTSDQIKQIATAGNIDTDWAEELMRRCNDADFVDQHSGLVWGDAAWACDALASVGAKTFGVNNVKVELAFQRACALPRAHGLSSVATQLVFDTEYGNTCAELGDLYRQRGDVQRALAIYLRAPNCHASGFEPAYPNLFDTACPFAADQILEKEATNAIKFCIQSGHHCSIEDVERAKQNEVNVEADFHQLCARPFSNSGGPPPVCDTHLNEQEQEAAERYAEQASALEHERAEQEYEQRQAAERAHDANVNALVSAIQSLPGGSDPNAIVDTANQQAANMIALGAANDAARAQAAAESAAAQQREQIAEQQREAQAQAQAQAQAVSSAPSAPASPVSPGQEGTTSSGGTAPQTGGSDNSGSGQFTSGMASSCVRMFNDSSMYGWVALQNTCSQKMTVTFEGKSGQNGNGGVFGTMDLAPGQSDNTGRSPSEIDAVGGIYTYPCPYGYIPTNMNGYAVTAPVTEFTCKYRGY